MVLNLLFVSYFIGQPACAARHPHTAFPLCTIDHCTNEATYITTSDAIRKYIALLVLLAPQLGRF